MNPNWSPTAHQNGYDLLARLEWEPFGWLEIGANGGRKSVDLGARDASGHAAGGDVSLSFGDFAATLEGSYGDLVFESAGAAAFGGHARFTWDFQLAPLAVLQPVLFVEYADAHSVYLQSESARVLAGVNVIHHDTFRVMPQVALTRPIGNPSVYNPWAERYEYYLMLSLDL
jgi:hypothetical protein